MLVLLSAVFLVCARAVTAANIFVQVGANTTSDGTSIFQPNNVTAKAGDTVWFNFTVGNHSATEADFSAPCVFIHDHDPTENGFDTGARVQGNGTSSTYPVPITPLNENQTFWFFDHNTCGLGGVGVINQNVSSGQTIEGFIRNAQRLNGTASSTSTRPSATAPSTSSSSASASTTPSSAGKGRVAHASAIVAVPLLLVGLLL